MTPRSTLGLSLALLLAVPSAAQTLQTRFITGGLVHPVCIAAPEGDLARVFVVEQDGRIRIVRDGVLLPTPFLDIDAEVNSVGREQGLLGLAFHPNFRTNGKYYVTFTQNSAAIVVRQYVVSANPGFHVDVSDTTNFVDVHGPLAKPQNTHNAGCLQFGPDGMLYISVGDGGGAFDNGPGHDPLVGNGQSLATAFGKLLRLDVDAGPPYDPGDNPYSSDTDAGYDLIWCSGLRNPWRFSFDPANGDLYIGDVGQAAREEVNWSSFARSKGANFGWRCQEGLVCLGLTGCICNLPAGTNPDVRNPVLDYPHANGRCAIVGGIVYRGDWMPELQGSYFYADNCTGRIWTTRVEGGIASPSVERTAELDPPGSQAISYASCFGTDGIGEPYTVDYLDGELYRIERVCPPRTNFCLTSPNSVGPGARMLSLGSSSLSAADLTLQCRGLPPGAEGYFFQGREPLQLPSFGGFLCVGREVVRLGWVRADGQGFARRPLPFANLLDMPQPGETRHYQFVYRDPGFGGALFNLSDGLSVPFCY